MCDMPEAFNSVTRKARKNHKCCECGCTIESGEKYQYSSGIWDGKPDSFKQCLNCNEIMLLAARLDDYEPPAFRELREWFYGFMCIDFKGSDFLNGMAKDIKIEPAKLNRLLNV